MDGSRGRHWNRPPVLGEANAVVFTVNNKLGDLFADPRVVEIVDKYIPGASTQPMLAKGKGMKISLILKLPQSKDFGFTPEAVDKILAEANAL
jgi:hypothetical protein